MVGSTRQGVSLREIQRSSPSRSKTRSISRYILLRCLSKREHYPNLVFSSLYNRFKPDKEGEIIQYTGISQSACREMAVGIFLYALGSLKLTRCCSYVVNWATRI